MSPKPERAGAPPAGRRRKRIVYSLLAVLVLVGLVPLAAFAFKLIQTSRRALVTSQQEIEMQLASSIAAELDTFTDGQVRQVATLAESFGASIEQQGLRGFEEDLRKRGVLPGLLDEQLVALRFAPLSGGIKQALMDADAPPPELERLLAGEFAALLASPGTAEAHQARVSEPILIGTGAFAGFVVTAPVYSGGALQGVLQGFVSIQRLWNRAALGRATGHEIYALDSRGALFAHTDPEAVTGRRDMRGLEIVQKFLASQRRSKETVAFSAVENGRRTGYLGAYDPTRRGWGIFVQVPESAAYALIQEMMRDTVTWAVVAIGLAILAGVVFAGSLSRPIRHLAETSRAFAGGDFSARAAVETGNEIGELADTFNLMASEIQEQFARLEKAAHDTNDLFLGTVRALAQAIDAKDPYTKGHSVRVNKYSVLIARYLGLSAREINNVHVASLLHDIGKIGIDDSILKKPANLTAEEFEVMKGHPEKGARIMEKIAALRDVVPGMRHHHERYAGGGYPQGLKGDAIPLIARIINVADTLDAMTTHRPYQAAFPFEAAVARINELKGTVCDPKVVEAFNRAYQSGEFELERRELAARTSAPAPAEPLVTA